MTSSDQGRGRLKPEDSDDDDDIDDIIDFSENVEGKFRSRVNEYNGTTQYPTAPLYSVGEIVYLARQGQSRPDGPYEIVAISVDRRYTIKKSGNGQQHPDAIDESRLLVKTS